MRHNVLILQRKLARFIRNIIRSSLKKITAATGNGVFASHWLLGRVNTPHAVYTTPPFNAAATRSGAVTIVLARYKMLL